MRPAILAVEAERIVYALELQHASGLANGHAALTGEPVAAQPAAAAAAPGGGHSADYMRGYRDAVLHLTDAVATDAAAAAAAAALDESQATWGLQVTKVVNSCRTGLGIRVAVLDTGVDEQHPDLAGRTLTTQSFIDGEAVQDGHGHGTHCIGTALGTKCPATLPRYGIAYEAEIFAGKVLSRTPGSGADAGILAGIEWAIAERLRGRLDVARRGDPARPGVLARCSSGSPGAPQEQGTLIVAAAGNESRRPDVINPVGHPANCPSILAVAALDVEGAIAPFSNRGINPDGGQIDIAGPGVDVLSSWPMPTRYPADQRHQHGHPARGRHRGAVRRVRPDGARRRARPPAHLRRAAARAAVVRRRGRTRPGALGPPCPTSTS